MTFYNEFKEESYSEHYQDSIETILNNIESAQYSLGEDVVAAINEQLEEYF